MNLRIVSSVSEQSLESAGSQVLDVWMPGRDWLPLFPRGDINPSETHLFWAILRDQPFKHLQKTTGFWKHTLVIYHAHVFR